MINREEPLGRSLNSLGKNYIGVIGKQLAHLDIERYFYVLVMIDNCRENATQQCIANKLGQNKTAMVRIVDYLVAKGYITRSANKADRREYRLELTEKAKLIMDDINNTFKETNAAALKGLTSEQIDNFYVTLQTIKTNIAALPADEYKVNFKKTKPKKK
jgi:MarR family transcriptional regulator for hemolysin